ncbi:MAG: CPBP family intramembrane metalloprotease [Phycisphaeraceae bacterium]|nr:CPBP family intramembrane metalloprotease [Phycisphaerales bacterium]MCB9861210.1 CPBP family intramembrane metalloprotease [Phycisphaeraceae bacterium]
MNCIQIASLALQEDRIKSEVAQALGVGACFLAVFVALALLAVAKHWMRFARDNADKVDTKPDSFRMQEGFVLVFGAFAMFFCVLVLQSIFNVVASRFMESKESAGEIASIGSYLCASVGLVMVCAYARNDTWQHVLWGSSFRMSVVRGVLCYVFFLPMLLGVSMILPVLWQMLTGHEPSQLAHELLRAINSEGLNATSFLIMVSAGLGAPVFEELLFRGCIQDGVVRVVGDGRLQNWFAILFTSVVFTSLHIGVVDGEYFALGPIFALSVACGLAFARRRCVLDTILVHMLFNVMSLAITVAIMSSDAASTAG